MMERNLDRRVEVLTPIRDRGHRTRLDSILDELLAEDSAGWELDADGAWTRRVATTRRIRRRACTA